MTDNLFDNFIKDKLQNYTSPVPADMWGRIVQKKEKRRTFFWWKNYVVIGAMLLAGLGGWYAMNANKTGNHAATLSSGVVENAPSSVPANADDVNGNATPAKANTPTLATVMAEENANSVKAVNDNANDPNANHAESVLAPSDKKISGISPNISSGSTLKIAHFKRSKALAHKAGAFRFSSTNEEINDEATSEVQSHFIYPYPSLLLAEKEHRSFTPVNLNNLRPASLSVDCPGTIDRSHGFYAEAFVSPDFSMRKVDAPLTEADYLRRKDSMESRLASFTMGLRLSKNLGQNLVFKTGIQYSQINEKFSFRAEDERRLTTIVTIRTITRPDGTTITVRDTSIIEQIGYRVKTSYNKYKSIDVPLLLGCEFGGEKWRGGFNLGAIINLSSWQQGETLDTSYSNTLPFSKENKSLFKKHVGLGLYGSLNLIRSISPSFDVFAEPYFRYNISRLTTNTSPFNQKFHVAGLLLGVRYNLNRQR